MVSNASDDLPLPESPVKTISLSRGRVTLTFLRLCSFAPLIIILSLAMFYPLNAEYGYCNVKVNEK